MKKYYFAFALVCVLAATLTGCRKEEQGDTPIEDEKRIFIVKMGSSDYVITYGDDDAENANQLAAAFKGEVGATMKTASTSAKEQTQEILLGKTSRDETSQLMKELGSSGYGIKMIGRKLVIAGTDNSMTALALFAFREKVLEDSECAVGKNLQIPKDYSYIMKDVAPVTLSECLKNGMTYTISTKYIGACPAQGDCYVSQGAASDGRYVWFVMRNSGDTKAVICKYTLNPFTEVGVGSTFNGGHCNDLTYDNHNKRVVLAHGQSQGKTLTLIDPESLNAVGDVEITVGSGAITFCDSRKRYAVSQGGTTLHLLSTSLSLLKSYSRTDGMTSKYIAQGMGNDDDYIYFPMSPQSGVTSDNILATYDWNGKYIDSIHIPLNMESESMFCVNGKYYVNFYNSKSAKLYQIIPVVKYRYVK